MINAIHAAADEHVAMIPRVFKRSESQARNRVIGYAIPYGGTVNSCARRSLYPNPSMIVGAKYPSEATPVPTVR